MAILLGFGSTLLSALQVGAGVNRLQNSSRFQDLSYAITMAALVFLLAIALTVLVLYLSLFGFHLMQTLSYKKKRIQSWGKWNEVGQLES